jgi:hypothetical protein
MGFVDQRKLVTLKFQLMAIIFKELRKRGIFKKSDNGDHEFLSSLFHIMQTVY